MTYSISEQTAGDLKKIAIEFGARDAVSKHPVPVRIRHEADSKPARRWFCGERWLRAGVKAFTPAWCGALVILLAGLLFALPAGAQNTVVFDFDNATPLLSTGQNLPFDQDSGGVTAHFSTASTGFSIQNYSSNPSLILSLFSGNYLYPNSTNGILVIQFSQPLTNISLDFATAEATPNEQPNPVRLTAYTNSSATPAVASASKAGTYIGVNGQPMGNLTLASSTPFNLVTLRLESGPQFFATGIMVDNITNWVAGTDHYTITTSASPPVGGTTTGGGTYFSNAPVTVVATANSGYMFVNWTENGTEVSTLASYDFPATSFRTLVANFVPTYSIVTAASPTTGGSTLGDGNYPTGSVATVSAIANPGFAFVNWTENGVPVSTWANYPATVDTNRTLVAHFAAAATIATSTASTSQGSTSGGGSYAVGATVMVVATPKTGYSFANWTENGQPASSSASYVFTVGANRALVANFTPNPNSATFDFDTGTPALTNNQATPFDQSSGGITASFSATNDPAFAVANVTGTGWTLSRFSGDCLAPAVLDGVLDIHFSQMVTNVSLNFATPDFQDILAPTPVELTAYTNSTTTPAVGSTTARGDYIPGDTMVMGTLSFSSTTPFNLVRVSIVPTAQGATYFLVDNVNVVSVGSSGYTIAATANPSGGGTITGAGTYNSGATVTLTASAANGYSFVNWTEGANVVGSSPTLTFTATASRTLVANFVRVWDIATTANPTAGGTIVGAGSYTNNASVTLTASAANGYSFVNWTEGANVVGSSPTLTFTATSSRTLVANFVQVWDIAATANPTTGGTIVGAGSYTNNASVTLTASAANGYSFVNWTEGANVVGSSPTLTFTATSSRTLVANFVRVWDIAATANPTAGGTIVGAGSYTNNASVTLTASPANGYAFVNWTEGANVVGSSPTLTFTATASRTLVANFTQAWNIVANASAAGGGTVTGGGAYTNGATVTVTAVPDADCAFVNWTEGSTILSAPATYTFTATANRTLVATFSPQLQILVTATNTAVISWSATSTGFTLQEATNCDGKTWMDSTNQVEMLQGRNRVIVPSSASGSFYRLSHP